MDTISFRSVLNFAGFQADAILPFVVINDLRQ